MRSVRFTKKFVSLFPCVTPGTVRGLLEGVDLNVYIVPNGRTESYSASLSRPRSKAGFRRAREQNKEVGK